MDFAYSRFLSLKSRAILPSILLTASLAHAQTTIADFNASTEIEDEVTALNLDAGSAGGSWTVNEAVHASQQARVAAYSDAAADIQVQLDGPRLPDRSTPFDYQLDLTTTVALDGSQVLSFDAAIRRSGAGASSERSGLVIGSDADGDLLFQLTIDGTDSSSRGTIGLVGQADSSEIVNFVGAGSSIAATDMSTIEIVLGAGTYDVIVDGTVAYTGIAYDATVTDLSRLVFTATGPDAGFAGYSIDNIALSSAGILPPAIEASRALIASGESTDLTITFDPTVSTATITLPAGSASNTDLKAIDAGDGSPNDGVVTITESPTADFTYQVNLTKTGLQPASSSLQVGVFTYSEPGDNSLSSAIKGDSPLFYYRFEEPPAAGFLFDSSGNGWHTNDITGSFGQGSSQGSVANAGECPGDVSILVPAQSEMNQSFTVCAVANNAIVGQAGNRHLFQLTDGSGTGRTILYFLGGSGVLSNASVVGEVLSDPTVTAVPDTTACLLHLVYDADTGDGTDVPEVRFYLNGQLLGTQVPVGTVLPNLGNWVLASGKTRDTNFLSGWIDEAAVFESVLSDVQIAAQGTAFFAAADPLLGFASDLDQVANAGDSVELTWKISDQATAVTLDGQTQPITPGTNSYTTTVNPTATTTYTLEVSGPGGPFTRQITVVVPGPVEAAQVTSIDHDDGNVTIDFSGSPLTTYSLFASSNLTDGFPSFIGNFVTDGAGSGTTGSFFGVGTSEFYRLEPAE